MKPKLSRILPAALATVALLVGTVGAASAASIKPPAAIAKAGKIVYCSDISYPPEEFFKSGNTAVGSDIDIGTEIARRMGVKAEFANTCFDGIIAALLSDKCDAIISGMEELAAA